MSQRTPVQILIAILFLITIALGYNYFFQPFAYLTENQQETEHSTTAAIPTPTPGSQVSIENLVAGLSTEQQVSQLLAVPVTLKTSSASDSSIASTAARTAQLQPGFVTLFGQSLDQDETAALVAALRAGALVTLPVDGERVQQILPAIAVDHEGGSVQRLSGVGFTQLPSWQTLCQMEQASRSALLRRSSLELQQTGIDIVLAPVIDTADQNNILRQRICSGDPAIVSARAQEFITLFELAEITPVIKHFPGIGQTTRDLHFGFQSIQPTQIELNVFRSLLDAYPQVGVMSTFVGVTSQDANVPCALSRNCVGQLKQEYPNVLLFSDALDMDSAGVQASGSATLAQRAEAALWAGNQVLIFGEGVSNDELETVILELAAKAEADSSFQTQLTKHVLRVLEYKQQKGLL